MMDYLNYLRFHSRKAPVRCPKCKGNMYQDMADGPWRSYLIYVCVNCGHVLKP